MAELQQQPRQLEQNNIRLIVTKYSKYWWLFALSLIICTTTIYFYIKYFSVNEYEIKSKILIKNAGAGKSINDVDKFNNLGLIKTSQSIEDEIGILASSGVMEEVISKNTFNITYHVKGSIKDVEIYGGDVPFKISVDETDEDLVYGLPINLTFIDKNSYELSTVYKEKELRSKHNYGELVTLPYATLTIVPKVNFSNITYSKSMFFVIGNKDKLVAKFQRNLSVVPDNKTGSLLSLSFVSNHQKKGEEVLSKLIETYIDKTIKYENELAENTIKMIDNRLKLLSGEIEDVESTVVDFKTENVVTNISSNADSYIQQANDYKNRVADYQTQIRVLEGVEISLVDGNNESTISGSFSINDITITDLINEYNQTLIKKEQLAQSASTSNPVIANLDASLVSLRKSILQNVRNVKNSFSIARGNLLANASRFDARIAKVPAMEKKLLDISRDKSTKEGLYLYLLQKREEEVLSLAAPVSYTRIVSLPRAGNYPISPNKKLFYLAGILLGLFIPFLIVHIKEALNNKISKIEDLTEVISVPFLGEIGKNKEKVLLVTKDWGLSPKAELFRLLHFNLDYLKKTEKNQTLLVTSTVRGEGKTYIASNLAVTSAFNGEKVVVLTFDLREPELMNNFNLPNSPGITDFILNKELDVNQIIQKHPTIENLHLVGSGSIELQVGRLMLSKQIKVLMDILKKDFDRIIIDTAPIGIISDAFALNSYIDSTIYVVRKDVTKKEYLKTIDSIHKNEKLKNTMVLLNDTDTAETTYGYGNKEI